jgi:hypothetical protein
MKTKIIQVYSPTSGYSRTVGYITGLEMTKTGSVQSFTVSRFKLFALEFEEEKWRQKAIAGLRLFNVDGS